MVSKIQANDGEGDSLLFGLEPVDFSLGRGQEPGWLPFAIDNATGEVFLNESLKDKVKIKFLSFRIWVGKKNLTRDIRLIEFRRCEYENEVLD